eukprot:gene8820-7779_t
MVFIADWDEFAEQSEALLRSNPNKTRCTVKYRHAEKFVIFKVTDDHQCFQFRTDQQQHLKYYTRLNTKIMEILTELASST